MKLSLEITTLLTIHRTSNLSLHYLVNIYILIHQKQWQHQYDDKKTDEKKTSTGCLQI